MSYSVTLVGPYIQVFNPVKEGLEKYKTCVNGYCQAYKRPLALNKPFCPECGSAVGEGVRPTRKRNPFDFDKEFGDKIYEVLTHSKPVGFEEFSFFVSNNPATDGGFKCTHESEVIEMTAETIDSDMRRFQMNRQQDINRLKEIFGAENVLVKWGTIDASC